MSDVTSLVSLAERAFRLIDTAHTNLEEARDLIDRLVQEGASPHFGTSHFDHKSLSPTSVRADRGTFTVHWNGVCCPMGPSVCFDFLEALVSRPNRYFSYNELIDAVWGGQIRSEATIRTVVRDIRRKLYGSDMTDLAKAIKGRTKTYGLILDASLL